MSAVLPTLAGPRPVGGARYPPARRVLFLADHLGLASGGVHGVTTYLLDVLPSLKSAGTEVGACFLREPHPAADVLRAHGIDVRFLGTRPYDPFVFTPLEKLVRRGGYEILHCTQFRASLLGRALARRLRRLRVVLHVHDMHMPPWPVDVLYRAVASPTDLGVCVSHAAGEIAVHGYHVRPERVRVLHTGVDTRAFRPAAPDERALIRSELGIEAGAPVLCLVGRFCRVKGHREMIRMLPEILRRRPNAVLLLAGDGPDLAACERLVRELELRGRVRFLGQRNDVARVLAASDVAVCPSQLEGLSRAAIEANLCGIPAVAFDTGGLAEALPDAVCGELVPPGDAHAFLAAVERALSVPRSRAAADARVQATTKRFGLVEHVQKLSACYDALLEAEA